jgi:hypothetical protein
MRFYVHSLHTSSQIAPKRVNFQKEHFVCLFVVMNLKAHFNNRSINNLWFKFVGCYIIVVGLVVFIVDFEFSKRRKIIPHTK